MKPTLSNTWLTRRSQIKGVDLFLRSRRWQLLPRRRPGGFQDIRLLWWVMQTNCGSLHIQPESWVHVKGSDRHTRAQCPKCGAFKGYVFEVKGQPKAPKGK